MDYTIVRNCIALAAVPAALYAVAQIRRARYSCPPVPTAFDETAFTTKYVKLSDGRTLAYTDHTPGISIDKATAVILHFHGLPSSRFEGFFWGPGAAARGFKLITIDRPGFGRSTPLASLTPKSWAENDVPQFLRSLGITKNVVFLGASGGGPYALACAAKASPDVVKGLILASAIAPVHDLGGLASAMKGTNPFNANVFPLLALVPSFFSVPLFSLLPPIVEIPKAGLPPQDAKFLTPEVDRFMRIWMGEAFVGGGGGVIGTWEAFVREIKCLDNKEDWGFELDDIRCKCVILHGDSDVNVHSRHAKLLLERIAGAELVMVEGVGHFGTVKVGCNEVLDIVSRW
ncbi:alpha/beta-hydrolase [Gonapodya prolifera JEL478]|uniref:Alpha/beta-hydrolase n=1 Tax=Gonapodya prolifera (strain JEL478) TaxID=1344416 RepID=A0A139AQH2_GONPJ|nr:alpha/beta-hydrolase [Gonapodya prolifera JEL478]|eukprot:KXS19011.1 alpha/beta-hydrolase [Gonapodya prolifera JEL478]